MKSDPKNKNNNIDFDELDDLPDIVLGEKTRMMRTLHNKGDVSDEEIKKQYAEKSSDSPANDKVNAQGEEDDEIPDSITDDDPGVKDELDDVLHIDIDSPADDKVNAEGEEDNEIPDSLTDDDPGVKDELSDVIHLDSKEDTDPLPAAKSELSEALRLTEVTGKHARGIHKNTVQQETLEAEKEPVTESTVDTTDETDTDDVKPLKKKKKRRTPLLQKIVLVILILLLILLGIGVYSIYDSLQPVQADSEEVKFEVDEGELTRDVASKLQKQGIIKNANSAYLYARYKHLTDIKYGVFTLDKSWDLDQLFTTLNDQNAAKKDAAIVTIVEGDWAKDAADKFAEVTNVSADDLLALWNNDDWLRSQMSTYPFITEDMFNENIRIDLEGYLSPATYEVNKETTAEEITTMVLNQTLKVYKKYAEDIAASGHSINEIYTMASIIQYEAGTNPDDLKNVAGVFYNRLNAGMKLQSSVTVCYAIDFDKQTDNWQACEANPDYDSPYNTYKVDGLPPGPIENPGATALEAAIHPADNDYLYFMADVYGDGKIYYAKTFEEHEANVDKYLHQKQ